MWTSRTIDTVAVALAVGLGGCVIISDSGDTEAGDGATGTQGTSASPTSGSSGPVADETGTSAATQGGGSANARCDAFCDELVAAMCSNGPTLAGCLLTCEALTSTEVCDPSANAYFDCVDGTAITCNAAGDPVAEGCGLVYLVAIGCAVGENPNPAIVQPCADYCDAIDVASCPGNGTVDECNTNCVWLGATGTGCDDEWGTYLTCANAANISCLLGFAVAEGCGGELETYYDCVDAAGAG